MDAAAGERAVSPLLGAILLAGFLVTALTIYQINVVPQENQEVEFEHYLSVIGDMQELRNAVISVAETNALEAVSVALGTRYPRRTFGINPPPPQGTLRTETTGSGIMAIKGVNMTALCGLERPVTTKSIVYEPDYDYLSRADPIIYDSTVLFREAEGGVVFESDQAIVQDTTISLPPVVGNISASSARTETFDFQGSVSGETKVSRDLKVTIPTRLPASTWEDDLLANEENVQKVEANGSNAVDIFLKADTYTLRCTAVGAGEAPDANPTLGDAGDEINPAGAGAIRLDGQNRSKSTDHVVTVELNNTGEIDVEIEAARLSFYHDAQEKKNAPTNADIVGPSGTASATLAIREDFARLSPTITLAGNDTVTDVELRFFADEAQTQEADLSDADWFVLAVEYSNGETVTYFVPVPPAS